MKFRFCRLILFIFLLVLYLPSRADPVHIEVIIFANLKAATNEIEWFEKWNERIRREEIVPVSENDQITEEEGDSPIEVTIEEPTEEQIEEPEPVASRLTDIALNLEESQHYEVLEFLNWTQEPERRSRTEPVQVSVLHQQETLYSQPKLIGELSIYEAQTVLQFEIDLSYKPVVDELEGTVFLPDPVSRYISEYEFKLKERRQVKIDEVHYFDHPKFGVIFSVYRP